MSIQHHAGRSEQQRLCLTTVICELLPVGNDRLSTAAFREVDEKLVLSTLRRHILLARFKEVVGVALTMHVLKLSSARSPVGQAVDR
ncbi:MAG: hypothetical protein AB7Q00_11530 [Phycisphaerales bacterium]